eukprot:jgi/Mesvir1/13295/Mv02229-RA.1
MTDLDTTGATPNDGYGEWTVEARMKTTAVGNVNNFGIFFVGDDYAGPSNGARVSLYCSANANLYIVTEDLGKTDRLLRIPFTYLEALTSAGNRPTNGAYHKYRLLRKTYTGAVEGLSDARNLFQLWYDDVEVNLQTGQNGVTLPDSVLQNPQIKVANSYLRIGGTTRQQSAQEVTYDYVRTKYGTQAYCLRKGQLRLWGQRRVQEAALASVMAAGRKSRGGRSRSGGSTRRRT